MSNFVYINKSGRKDGLSERRDYQCLLEEAEDSSTPARRLEELYEIGRDYEDGGHLLACVGENPNTPFQLLEALARHQCFGIRYSVARNPSTPVQLLEMLAEDVEPSVAYMARDVGRW